MLTVKDSRNSKIGNVSATYRGKQTCPSDCLAFKACYAKAGMTNIQFIRAGLDKAFSDTIQLVEWIASLPVGRKIRHHVSGDFAKDGESLDNEYLDGFIGAMTKRPDIQSWGYTHAWKKFKENIFKTIPSVNINASCDNIAEIKAARAKGFDTVVIMPDGAKTGMYDGEKVVICPNQIKSDLTCEKCMLCFRKNRSYSIGFRIHGTLKKYYQFTIDK